MKEINQRGFHGDLKLSNIAVSDDPVHRRGFIIDYGLSKLYKTYNFTNIYYLIVIYWDFGLGNQQNFIDNIIIYKLLKMDKRDIIHKLYDIHAKKILQTIESAMHFLLLIYKCVAFIN